MESIHASAPARIEESPQGRGAILAARIILGGGLGMFLNLGPVVLFTYGIFIQPISAQTGWSALSLASAIGPAMLITALSQPAIGYLLDRHGARKFALVSIGAFGLGIIALGALPGSARGFSWCLALATLLGAGQTPLPYSFLVSRWFDRGRGTALGIALAFSGLGVAVWPAVVGHLLAVVSWRQTYMALGGMVLALGALAVALIRDPARNSAHDGADHAPPSEGVTLGAAMATGSFWLLVVVAFVIAAEVTGATVHLPAMLATHGASPQAAASLASVLGIASIVSRLFIGVALDYVFAPIVGFAVFAASAAGCLLLVHTTADAPVVAAVLLGIGLGAEADILAFIASRIFGVRHFGSIYGVLMVVFLLGTSAGPTLFAVALNGHGGYPAALLGSAIAGACAACLTLMLSRSAFKYMHGGGTPGGRSGLSLERTGRDL
ncbi:MFS transporter [Paraburkholderia sp. J63]|uniref:MFS transporter n=1 Tax=Paraburkholderia sp. J63 TaxID=2805434 RepID=UPI002ABE0E0D|nr:MFS transporter [Paraburkholderia sp. J63]